MSKRGLLLFLWSIIDLIVRNSIVVAAKERAKKIGKRYIKDLTKKMKQPDKY